MPTGYDRGSSREPSYRLEDKVSQRLLRVSEPCLTPRKGCSAQYQEERESVY